MALSLFMPYDQSSNDFPSDEVDYLQMVANNEPDTSSSFSTDLLLPEPDLLDYLLYGIFDLSNEREREVVMPAVKKIIQKLQLKPNASSSNSSSGHASTSMKKRVAKYPVPAVAVGESVTIYIGSDSNGYKVVHVNSKGNVLTIDRCTDEGKVFSGMGVTLKWGRGRWRAIGEYNKCAVGFGQAVNYRDPGF